MFFKKPELTGFVYNPEHDNDPRNLVYGDISYGASNIPESGNVIERKKIVLNQDRTHACTAYSTVGAIHQTTGKILSPRYAYNRIKKDPKFPSSNLDYGAYMKDSVALQVKEGICDYIDAPSDEYTSSEEEFLRLEITDQMKQSADANKGGSYAYVGTGGSLRIFDETVRYMNEQKLPVKIGLRWYTTYNSARKGGVVPPIHQEGLWYGHDMAAMYWKDIEGEPYIGFINSWGPNWGDGGLVWIPRNYSHFYTGLAYIPQLKSDYLKIKTETVEITEPRNFHKERANAQELKAYIDLKFGDEGTPAQKASNSVARGIAGREWLVIVKAVTYLGWTFIDVTNYLYAHSRGQINKPAYNLDFTQFKK